MDQTGSIGLEVARAHIARKAFSDLLGGPELGRMGLEPEYLVLQHSGPNAELRRLPLEGPSSVMSALERLSTKTSLLRLATAGPPPVYDLGNGGRITFEPGGQVEHSTAVHATAAAAMDDVDDVAVWLGSALEREGASLVSAGLDIWTDRSKVEQQLRAPRYHSMAAYLASRSEHGAVMMRHTGSFQVNLDLGTREMAQERWCLANLLNPVATASFACSPEDGWKSRRARAWQGLDPTRTGFPTCMLTGALVDPGLCYAELALDADILLFRTEGHGAVPGTPGFRMRDWIEAGHPEFGWPTLNDIEYHLTTIFPEVRLRGFFEIRTADAVPIRWRAAQVVFWAGLLYDAEARREALRLLTPSFPLLRDNWVLAARVAFDDDELHSTATTIWRLAMEGARRLPSDYFRAKDMRVADAFVERFVQARRTPGDELKELLDRSPREAMEWTRQTD